jgi:hypothetical protein
VSSLGNSAVSISTTCTSASKSNVIHKKMLWTRVVQKKEHILCSLRLFSFQDNWTNWTLQTYF